jgi:hypothetical protein
MESMEAAARFAPRFCLILFGTLALIRLSHDSRDGLGMGM